MINSKKKKEKKKRKQTMADDAINDDDELNSIPTPHVLDLWPFRLSAFIFHTGECMSLFYVCFMWTASPTEGRLQIWVLAICPMCLEVWKVSLTVFSILCEH